MDELIIELQKLIERWNAIGDDAERQRQEYAANMISQADAKRERYYTAKSHSFYLAADSLTAVMAKWAAKKDVGSGDQQQHD